MGSALGGIPRAAPIRLKPPRASDVRVVQDPARGAEQSRRRLFASSLLTIEDFHCSRPVGEIGTRNEVAHFELLLPRQGAWVMHAGSVETLVDPNSVALLAPDREYRNTHPTVLTTRSTAIRLGRRGVRALSADLGRMFGRDGPAAHTVVPRSAAFDLVHRHLVHQARHGDGLALEEIAMRIAALVVREGWRPRAATRRPATERRHRDLVEATKALLNSRLRSCVSLVDVAGALEVSPYHLSRVFTAHTGLSLYRYFLRLRLLAAMEVVLAGASITEAALELGFADHSHLTNRFRREFGVPPQSLRRAPEAAVLQRWMDSLASA